MTNEPGHLQASRRNDILEKADRCVYCGMCLPVCPTYQLAQQEAESPRGRLSLLTAYYQQSLLLEDALKTHLDHCLLCRSCENICPANVPFASIMDSARADILALKPEKLLPRRALLFLIQHKKFGRFIINSIKRLSLDKFINRTALRHSERMQAYLQAEQSMQVAPKWKQHYSAVAQVQDRVGLFLGCVHEFVDSDSLDKTIKVLNRIGVDVVIPDQQQCCGAMHLHSGEAQLADTLYQKTCRAFIQHKLDTVISLSTACTVTLLEQSQSSTEQDGEQASSLHFTDLCTYLESRHWYQNIELESVDKTVLLHYPCSQKNVLKNSLTVYRMLKRVPGLRLREFKTSTCCGAAGTYMLDYPRQSNQLKQLAASQVSNDVDILVTTNIGCFMQFRSMSNLQRSPVVLHPVQIIAQALSCQ